MDTRKFRFTEPPATVLYVYFTGNQHEVSRDLDLTHLEMYPNSIPKTRDLKVCMGEIVENKPK